MNKEALIEALKKALNEADVNTLEKLATEAIENYPEEGFGYAYQAEFYLAQEPVAYSKAEQNIALALSKDSDNANYLVRFAEIKADQDLAEDARILYLKALRADENNTDALVGLGLYQMRVAGSLESALQQFEKAKALDASYAYLDLYMAEAYYYKKDFEEAQKILEASASSEFDLDASLLYINILDELKLFDKICAQFEQLIKAMPDTAEFYLDYAKYQYIQKDYKGTIASVEKGIALSSDDVLGSYIVYEPYFGALKALNEHDKLSGLLNDTIKKNPDNSDLIILRAQANVAAGKLDAAQSDYEHLVELSPTENEKIIYKFELAQVLLKKKDNGTARSLFDEIKKIDPGLGALGKASVLFNNGDLEASFEILLEQKRKGNRAANEYIKQNFKDFLDKKKNEILKAHATDIADNKNHHSLSKAFGNFYQINDLITFDGSKLTNDIKKILMSRMQSYSLLMSETGIFIINPNDFQHFTYKVLSEDADRIQISCIPLDGDRSFNIELSVKDNGLNISQDSKLIFTLAKGSAAKISGELKTAILQNFDKSDLAYMGDHAKSVLDQLFG